MHNIWALTFSSKEAYISEDVLGTVTELMQLNFFDWAREVCARGVKSWSNDSPEHQSSYRREKSSGGGSSHCCPLTFQISFMYTRATTVKGATIPSGSETAETVLNTVRCVGSNFLQLNASAHSQSFSFVIPFETSNTTWLFGVGLFL